MKKILILASIAVILGGIIAAGVLLLRFPAARDEKAFSIRAGSAAENFVVGTSGTAAVNLKDLFGRYTIVLAFLGEDSQSLKFAQKMKLALGEKLMNKEHLIWLNVQKNGFFCVVEEESKKLGLKYRFPWLEVPRAYRFPMLPSIIIIDKFGVVKFVYIGYSPTMMDDLAQGLEEKKK